MRSRGFLLGATAGRTTLAGEGLQHTDGHSHLLSANIPNCISYDPTFSFELAVIIQDGLRHMIENNEDVFYYITLMNENYLQPDMPKGVEDGILKGMYLFQKGDAKNKLRIQLMGSGTILREVIAAAELLKKDFNVVADVWSVTSFTELRRDGMSVERANMLHPEAKAKESFVETCLKNQTGPVIAATDYMRSFSEQIRPFVPGRFVTLGTDGFGRSDTRVQLRHFFEVDAKHIALAAMKALADEGEVPASKVSELIKKYNIDPKKSDPWTDEDH